jgi:hypothetical protein
MRDQLLGRSRAPFEPLDVLVVDDQRLPFA